ncbi:MAG: hypothetical protein K2P68_08735 [Sphingomonas sp.]|nr:hypothetical protein [Sphingomonas sp.]
MKAQTMRRVRQWHLYLGLFFAPMLLLFAISGAFQTFRLNEPKGFGGTPPAALVWIAAIHKNQGPPGDKPRRAAEPDLKRSPARETAAVAGGKAGASASANARLPLKIFVVLLGVALALSTLLGMMIALNSRATRLTGVIMLVLGTALPIILLKMQG